MTQTSGSSSDASELTGVLRIGELSRRTGVKDHQLRSWEQRYGLITPQRSDGGFRLYSLADERRVLTMKELVEQGLSPAQAARVALSPPATEQWTQSMQLTQLALAAQPTLEPAPTPTTPASPPASPTPPARTPSAPAPGGVAALIGSPEPETGGQPAPIWQPRRAPESSAPLDQIHAERDKMLTALTEFNDEPANAALDRLLANLSTEMVLREAIVPMMRTIGDNWAASELSVAQEHFASSWVRGRLNSLARGWAGGTGPVAVVASPSGELHDLAGMAFGIALHRHGWRVIHLGANTPVAAMSLGGRPLPDVIMCSALNPLPLELAIPDLRALAATTRVVIAGTGANPMLAAQAGCSYLPDDPVTAAARVAQGDYPDPLAGSGAV